MNGGGGGERPESAESPSAGRDPAEWPIAECSQPRIRTVAAPYKAGIRHSPRLRGRRIRGVVRGYPYPFLIRSHLNQMTVFWQRAGVGGIKRKG